MTWNAYHFVGARLRDGRPVPADGELLRHDGPVAMCESGLHASRHPFDALIYAPGFTLCRVHCADIVESGKDKFVCRERTIVARIDARDIVLRFARMCASDVLHMWPAPEVVRNFLKTGDRAVTEAARVVAADAANAAVRATSYAATADAYANAYANADANADANAAYVRKYRNRFAGMVGREFKKRIAR